MGKFKPVWVRCTKHSDSFTYSCNTMHEREDNPPTNNTYRFTGKPLTHLIKNKEDYEELVSLPHFEDHVAPEEEPVSEPSETSKQKKMRERKENKEAKKAQKEAKKMGDEETTQETTESEEVAKEDEATTETEEETSEASD